MARPVTPPPQLLAREAYRPSNGDEGHWFIRHWCGHCKRDAAFRADPDTGPSCPIVANALAFGIDDPSYPAEWQYGQDGRPCCAAFEVED